MRPVQPEFDGRERVLIAEDQHEYEPLPATVGPPPQYEVTTEWVLDSDELLALVYGNGRIRLKLWTFGGKLCPVKLDVVTTSTGL